MKSKQNKVNKTTGKYSQTDPVQVAADYEIDVSALIDNTGRSCTERFNRHQIALNMVERFRKAREL